ncbi:hypothetical protein [Longimicrobium sp.]|jgi:hypothetical protein|uniref:hypothetical protein n=1 Tax=Longimicrobium sp. TaxID=2029185 RepID=UPI002F92F613
MPNPLSRSAARLSTAAGAIGLLAAPGCAHLGSPSGARAVEVARENVCGAPGSDTDRACSVREHGRVRGGYRVVVDRRPPAGNDRVAVTLGRNGRTQVETLDSLAQPRQPAAAQEGSAAVDAAIYTAALAHLGYGQADRKVLVVDSTMDMRGDASRFMSVPDDVRAGFTAANEHRRELPRGAFPAERFRVVPNDHMAGLPRSDPGAYWTAFRERYPGYAGVIRLSGIGRSADGSRAAVYVTYGCGALCGAGHLVTLRNDGGSWRVVEAKMLWVS